MHNCVTLPDGATLVRALDGAAQVVLDQHCFVVKTVMRLPASVSATAQALGDVPDYGAAEVVVQMHSVFGVPKRYRPAVDIAIAYEQRMREHHKLLSLLRAGGGTGCRRIAATAAAGGVESTALLLGQEAAGDSAVGGGDVVVGGGASQARRRRAGVTVRVNVNVKVKVNGEEVGSLPLVSGGAPTLEEGRKICAERAAALGHLVDPARCTYAVVDLPTFVRWRVRGVCVAIDWWRSSRASLAGTVVLKEVMDLSIRVCGGGGGSVSYTHLTLPTIYSV